MKYFVLSTFYFLSVTAFGQNINAQLNKVNTIEQAENFVELNSNLEAEIINISPELENNDTLNFFSRKKESEVFTENNKTFKVIKIENVQAFRVSYIFLDGSKISTEEIEVLRTKILNEYNSGTPFSDLAKRYTMDNSPNGDLGWFTEGMMYKEFESEIKRHKLNDIFTIDIPSEKWYYVTLKTFNEKGVKQLTLLKVKSS